MNRVNYGAQSQKRLHLMPWLGRSRRASYLLVYAAVVTLLLTSCATARSTAAPQAEVSITAASIAEPTINVSMASPTIAGPITDPTAAEPSPPTSTATAHADALIPGQVTELATGLNMPWGLTFLPDGSALVSGRHSAQISHVPADGGRVTVVGVVPGVEQTAEGGLLGLAASPSFAEDRTVFAYVSSTPTNRVVALTIGDDLRSLRQERVVLDGIVTANRHHGGRLQFGPDGNLWLTTGDAFQQTHAPDRNSLNGKVLRIRPDGSVPSDNPFGTPVWTTGHRNVQGITFGPDGTVYTAELGLNNWDELNVLQAGSDYGWPSAEGHDGVGGVRPIFVLTPSEASPSGVA